MGALAAIRDFVLFRDLPANQPPVSRALPAVMEQRSLSGTIPGWKSGTPSWPDDNVMVLTRDGYRKCVTAFACINIIADAVAEATLRAYEDKGSDKRDELRDHPMRQLMQRPNASKSESEFLSLVVRIAAITGYCVVEKVRAGRRNVIELGIMDYRYLRPILVNGAQPDWQYTIPGHEPAILKAEDAIVFTYLDSPLLDQVMGDTPMRAILRQAGILHELTDFVKMLLERGGMPQIVLVVDSANADDGPIERLTEEEIELTRETFRQKYAGYQNWAGPAVIDGMRVEKVGFDLNELAFTALRDGLDLSVCSAFRVPPPLVQVMAGLTTSYGKTLEESMTMLQRFTANPIRARLDGALTRQLLPEFDSRPNVSIEFDTSAVDALQEDEDAIHTRAREDLRSGGVLLDEFRQRIDLEPLGTELGRSLYLPFSVIPTLTDTPLALPAPTPTPEPDPDPDDEDPDSDEARARRAAEPPFVTRQDRRYVNERALHPVELARRAKAADVSRLNQARLANVLGPQVQAFLQGQKERVLEAVTDGARSTIWEVSRHAGGTESLTQRAIEQLDWFGEDEELRKVFQAWWHQVGEVSFQATNAELGTDLVWDVSNPSLRQLVDQLGQQIVGINETTRQDVERIVREQLLKGTTIDALAGELEGLFDETYKNRHVTVARTESMYAYGDASALAYQESGMVQEVVIYDNPAHTASYKGAADGLTCAQRNQLVAPVARGPFHIRSDHPNGQAAMAAIVTPLGDV